MKPAIQIVVAMLAGFCSSFALAETVLIEREIPLGEDVFIPAKIRGKCDIGRDFSGYLTKSIGKSGFTVRSTDDSLRDRAAAAEKSSAGNVRRAGVDLEVANIELEAAEYDVQEAKTQADRSAAELRVAEAKMKKAQAELFIANANQNADNDASRLESAPADDSKFLFVEIDQIDASTGGAFSGRKMIHVVGEYRQGTELIASFKGRRSSGGGVFGGYKGTCTIMKKNLKVLAEDIGNWMKSPRDNAGIGELD